MYYLCFDKRKSPLFCSAGRYVSENAAVHPRRRLDTAVLLLGYSGEYPIAQQGREYTLTENSFQILFPGHEHYGTAPSKGQQSHFWCHFYLPDGWSITDDTSKIEDDETVVIPEFSAISDSEKYYILFCQLIDESEKAASLGSIGSEVCDCYVKILLCLLSQAAENNGRRFEKGKRSAVAKIKEFLRHNALSGINARDAATALGYNSCHLNRLVKADTGMTLCAYLNSIRLRHAKSLLLNSDLKISQIAEVCGFGDEKYFMRLFKKCESVTPTQYREAHFRVHLNHL